MMIFIIYDDTLVFSSDRWTRSNIAICFVAAAPLKGVSWNQTEKMNYSPHIRIEKNPEDMDEKENWGANKERGGRGHKIVKM